MIQPCGGNFCSVDVPLFAAADFAKLALGGHHADIDGKVRFSELSLKDLSQAIGPEIFRLKAVEVKAVSRLKQRIEKRKPLDMVPMIMSDQDVGVESVPAMVMRPLVTKHPEARAAIEYERSTVGSGKFEARRVSAVAPCVALECRR